MKMLPRGKHFRLFGILVSDEEKKSYNIDTRCQAYKTCVLPYWMYKLECLSLISLVYCCV
jgi:hypothetical protein